jgi:hypothetical protein
MVWSKSTQTWAKLFQQHFHMKGNSFHSMFASLRISQPSSSILPPPSIPEISTSLAIQPFNPEDAESSSNMARQKQPPKPKKPIRDHEDIVIRNPDPLVQQFLGDRIPEYLALITDPTLRQVCERLLPIPRNQPQGFVDISLPHPHSKSVSPSILNPRTASPSPVPSLFDTIDHYLRYLETSQPITPDIKQAITKLIKKG